MKNKETAKRTYREYSLTKIARVLARELLDRWQGSMGAIALGGKNAGWLVMVEHLPDGVVFRITKRTPKPSA